MRHVSYDRMLLHVASTMLYQYITLNMLQTLRSYGAKNLYKLSKTLKGLNVNTPSVTEGKDAGF